MQTQPLKIKVIGFDADDTLWENQAFYDAASDAFYEMMTDYLPKTECADELYRTEMQNMPIYGFGARAFTLSIIETCLRVSKGEASSEVIAKIIDLGKNLSTMPVQLIDGVKDTLEYLLDFPFKIVLVTKGDLLDQERKCARSSIANYFHHIEIVSDKQPKDYQKLLMRLNIQPQEFLMVGNSLKSDVLPVTEMGGYGIHIPHSHTWIHEQVDAPLCTDHYWTVGNIREVKTILEEKF